MKKKAFCFLMCLCCLQLCGCTAFPNYSKEDTELIAEYAAGLLIQHSSSVNNRLTDVETDSYVMEDVKQGEEENMQDIPENPNEPASQLPDMENEIPVSGEKEEVFEETTYPLNVLMGLQMLDVQCTGYEIKSTYADNEDVVLDAKDGNKLVILKFTLTNPTENTVELNQLENDATYRVSLNQTGYKQTLSTLLLNDLSTYTGSIKSGETTELVLLSEWDTFVADGMNSISLHIQNNEMSGSYMVE